MNFTENPRAATPAAGGSARLQGKRAVSSAIPAYSTTSPITNLTYASRKSQKKQK